ncbi:methyltransferase domain-containing protein [Pseudovibrio exalbescens]|uniref:class I SAM-dependent methyltransferase n=1 Tax=Pseudovibrio exalbescens TaxID=197461 RepID=UPI002365CEF1|nr:methyltransferase domain-containing protein [Pseudovibrio exalbescens]MDD7909346.1 methyltransferase domain-containing protein [Pseudovibrio exalbescens]
MSKDFKDALVSLEKCQKSLFKARHFDDMKTSLTAFKQRYDANVGELSRLKQSVPHFLNMEQLLEHKLCDCLDATSLEVGAYPQRSHLFSTLLLVRCATCGSAHVPKMTFDLDKYYSAQYAHDVQQFRTSGKPFFGPENEFLQSKTYERMKNRAKLMLSLAGDHEDHAILDFGCGVGILLHESEARTKYAVESDQYALRILQGELGVTVTALENPDLKLNAIYASHVLEHLAAEDLMGTLAKFRALLKAEGKLVIFVPDGADHIQRLKAGSRDGILFEPHTLHFSLKSLIDTMTRAGFSVTHASRPTSVKSDTALYSADYLRPYADIPTADLAVVGTPIN